MHTLNLIKNDSYLAPYEKIIIARHEKALNKEMALTAGSKSLNDFASGYMYFGLHKEANCWIFREWAPNATALFLVGNFSGWEPLENFALHPLGKGIWEISLPLETLKHGDLYRLFVKWKKGSGDRIPAWATRVVQDEKTLIFNAQVWDPAEKYIWKNKWINPKDRAPFIYEAHVGMSGEEEKVSSYQEFTENILPWIADAGYNVLQLMAIQEHPFYGSFGYHVSSFFAPSSRFGNPEDLKKLIDKAHGLGITVVMDLIHSHAVKNEVEGLGLFDGTPYQYFHENSRREHPAWGSLCFNYEKNEVLHFLLSNCKYWLEEFHFDGFRCDGITSMLYLDHGLSRNFTDYKMYYDGQEDEDAFVYLTLANKLIHEVRPDAITIAEEMSGMPGTASPFSDGGLGFDYRLAMGIPDYWIKTIKEIPDEKWNVGSLYYELTNKRKDEKTISYVESHDQALVGDKTVIFRLIDKEMYTCMDLNSCNLVVERGIALHKMIRLVTLATAGNGYLNFMGNEFGHPDWIDFPRSGNKWSYKYACRHWHLATDENLKYKFLLKFDKAMIKLMKDENCLNVPEIQLLNENVPDKILIFRRGELIFIFNFNPSKSFQHYAFKAGHGKYKVILSSDAREFGGQERIDQSMAYYTGRIGTEAEIDSQFLKLYIPCRTACVLKKQPVRQVYDLLQVKKSNGHN